MTREEAREILTHNWTRVDNPNYSESDLDEAFFMAIEALSNNITESPNGAIKPSNDVINRADAIKAVAKLQKYDLDERNRLRIYAPWHKPKRIFVETEAVYKCIYTIPSADADGEDLIIKGAKGIQDGLYNIKDGKLFKYKANGGTVRTYPIVPSADTVSRNEYEEVKDYMDTLVDAFIEDGEELAESVKVVRKPIKGYEDYYEVDQFGRVFAKERTIHVTDHDREYDKHLPSRQMKQSVHTKGYKTVPLTKDGVCTSKFVHRLVAEAFIPNPDDLPFVNHIDEDKTNNFVENLEWCTEQYNSTYGKAREKHAKALKGRHHTEEHKKKISDSLKRFYGERREP